MEMVVEDIGKGVTTVLFRGRLDAAGAQEVQPRFAQIVAGGQAVVVDLSGVSYIASLGIHVLVSGAKAIAKHGGKIVLAAPDGPVANVLSAAGISALIPIFPERGAAIASIARSG